MGVPKSAARRRYKALLWLQLASEGDGLNGGRLQRFAGERFRVSVLVTYTCRCAVRWPSGRRRRFAKRKSASRTSSFFLVNPSLFSTSQIDRVGWRWLSRRCFGGVSGTIVGTVPSCDVSPSVVRALSDLRSDSPPQRDQSTTSRRLCRCSRADGAILDVVSATECATRTLVAW